MMKLFYILALALFLSNCSQTHTYTPMLWEISGNNLKQPSYIFGTFHTRDPNINELPTVVTSALTKTQRLYTEIAMTHKNTSKILDFSKSLHQLPLKQRLRPRTIQILVKHLKKYRLPHTLRSLQAYKTWSIALMLLNYKEAALYADTKFMDERLSIYAKLKHIKQAGLESPIEQLNYFDTLSSSLQEQLLLDTLEKAKSNTYAKALKAWYIKGSEKGFFTLQEAFMSDDPKQKKLDKTLHKGLLIERNSRFIKRIDILLKSHSSLSYFFAIGAGHLSGDKGIIQELRNRGYSLKKLN